MSFDFLFELVGAVMSWLYDIHASYGFMIIGATLIALVVTTPLTFKSTRSMLLLRRLQPDLRKLQDRHRDDRPRLNDELRLLYREHRINPLGGCLPLLVQMPVFAVLSAMLHGLVRRAPDVGSAVGWVTGHAGRAAGTVPPLDLVRPFDPAYLPPGRLADDLHASSTLPWFGMNLADSCQAAFTADGLLTALPYIALVAVVAVTGVLNQRQSRSGRSGAAPSDPLQELTAKVVPLILPVVSLTLPAGLVLYFAVTNLFRLGQQFVIARTLVGH